MLHTPEYMHKLLTDELYVNDQYVNKTLRILASDVVDDGSITYSMNEHGYRSKSFDIRTEYNVLTLGCSWTMGIGVNEKSVWGNVLTDKLQNILFDKKITHFNYGMYGCSTSFIAKQLYKITKTKIIPDMVLIMWPGFSRRDYLTEDGMFRKIGGFRHASKKDLVWKNESEDLSFIELQNDFQDMMIFWESYKFVETLAKLHNIKIFHTIAGYYYEIFMKNIQHLNYVIDKNTFFLPTDCYKNDLLGRDKIHPGEQWHQNFGNSFFNFIIPRIH